MEKKLTKKELKELVGGRIIADQHDSQTAVRNINEYHGCECTYKNKNTISNENNVKECRCTCV